MDFSYPATLAWPVLRHLLLWSLLPLWQFGIFVFLCSPADGSDSFESGHHSNDSTEALPNDAFDSWPDNYKPSRLRAHLLSRYFEPACLSSRFPRFWAEVGCRPRLRPDPVSRNIPRTPYSEARHRQLRFSSTAVLPPSNTPLTRNITKAFERAPGIWPP
jgi:hypothetical protein